MADLVSHRSALSSQRIILLSFVLRIATAIVFIAVLGRILEPADYGYLSLIATLVVVIRQVLDLGVGNLVTREIVSHPDREQAMIEGLMGWRAWLSALVTLALLVFALMQDDVWRSAVVVSLAIVTPSYIVLAKIPSFMARQAVLGPALMALVLQLLMLGGLFTMIHVGVAGVAFCWLIIGREVLSNAGNEVMFRRLVSFRPRIAPLSKEIRQFLRSAFIYSGAVLLHGLYFNSDVILVYWLRGEAELGAYSAAFRPINPVLDLPYLLAIPLVPTLTRIAADNLSRLKALVTDLTMVAFGIGLVASIAGWITAPEFIEVLYAGNYLGGDLDATGAFAWLSVALSAICVSAPLVVALLALKLERRLLTIAAAGLGINVVANLLLLPRFGFEIAAVTTAATEVLVCLLMLEAVGRALGYGSLHGWLGLVIPPVVAAVLLIWIDLPAYPTIALGCAIGFIAVLAIARSEPGRRAKAFIDDRESARTDGAAA